MPAGSGHDKIMIQLKKEHFFFAVWALQRGISHSEQAVFFYERIIFVPAVVEGYIVTGIGINSGKGNNRSTQIAADVFDNGFGIAKIGFGINVKAVLVFAIDFCFGLLFYCAPETVIRISTFGKKAVDVRIPFKRAAKSMKDADKTRNEILGFVQGEKEFFNHIGNSIKKAVKQVTVCKKKRPEGFVNGEDEMPVCAVD